MKTMTCKQLGGACDKEFQAETFEEMKGLSMSHAHEMYQKNDKAHMEVMAEMKELMKDPKAIKKWMENKKKEFNALPQDN
ncbi:DUF1059 domain-containing protein [Candidatus Pacearchaeota archaeon]|nr:DUF1059 domain-containing protein [Candidatus Pacearchaeota archaeon]